jgi:DNA helicase-2/ATP-dependent DNA helicase PcrA
MHTLNIRVLHQGSKIELMRRFRFDFSDADVIRLGTSYRNAHVVLSAATTLIQHNTDRIIKHTAASPLYETGSYIIHIQLWL